jgi:hypothetical protein
MGYNVEISVNILKETNFSEIENTIYNVAERYNCESIYSISEENGTKKMQRYNYIYVVCFLHTYFEDFIQFLLFLKNYRPIYVECIYENEIHKLLYASSFYLTNINRDISNNYKQFIKNKQFTPNESLIINIFID